MKYLNKESQYQSKEYPHPTYFDSYVRDGKITIGEQSKYMEIIYIFCHLVDGKEVIIDREPLTFTEEHIPTMMKTGEEVIDGETQIKTMEVYEAILNNINYDKNLITNWGKPDLHKIIQMFEIESLTNNNTGVSLRTFEHISVGGNIYPIAPDQAAQIKQLMIDWVGKNIMIEGEILDLNFSIQMA